MSCENPGASTREDVMQRRPKFDRSKDCVKCKENRGNIVVRHAVFCKACFFSFVLTKFKRALDPYINEKTDTSRRKTLKASGNLLLGLSGGLGSTMLMDIINEHYLSRSNSAKGGGKNHPRNDRVWNEVYVCYVETCAALPVNARDRTDEVREAMSQYENVYFIPLRIEDAFDASWWARNGGDARRMDIGLDTSDDELPFSAVLDMQSIKPSEALKLYFSRLPTQTAIATTIQTLVRRLLLQTAQATGSSHLLLGTSLTSLSIAHISSIAQGGGFSVREEVQEEWRHGPASSGSTRVRVVRPLRDIGMKECGFWAWWRGLRIIGRDRYLGGKHEIGALTRDFIIGLEADFPSTVSTIARTCAKVEPKEEPRGICAICDRPAQRDAEGWKSRISIRDYTSQLPLHQRDKKILAGTQGRCAAELETGIQCTTLAPHLCYLCHTTLISKSSRGAPLSAASGATRSDGPVPLPVWVNPKLRANTIPLHSADGEIFHPARFDQSSMRKAIGEFLLTDD